MNIFELRGGNNLRDRKFVISTFHTFTVQYSIYHLCLDFLSLVTSLSHLFSCKPQTRVYCGMFSIACFLL